MNFERRKIEKRHSQRIILEFDVVGDMDLDNCQKIANSLASSIPTQLSAECHIEVTCSKALVQPLQKRTYDQVQLPPKEMTVSVLSNRK